MWFNLKKVYFAVVSIISVIVVGVAAVDLIGVLINSMFPELVASDMARLSEMADENDMPRAMMERRIMPLYTEIVRDALQLVIFGLLLLWHLPRLLKDEERDL